MTSAAVAPVSTDLFIGTSGNGLCRARSKSRRSRGTQRVNGDQDQVGEGYLAVKEQHQNEQESDEAKRGPYPNPLPQGEGLVFHLNNRTGIVLPAVVSGSRGGAFPGRRRPA